MHRLARQFLWITIPLLFVFATYMVFQMNGLSRVAGVMTVSFLLLVPCAIGALTIYFSNIENVKSTSYQVTKPWLIVGLFMIITIAFTLEGAACWIMALPLFLISSSIGGLIAGYFKLKKHQKNERINLSFLILLPFFAAPVEKAIGSIPGKYKAYTYIDLRADKARIWDNVTRVRAIDKSQDKGWLTRTLGFPRPIRAELNYNGVGGYRKAIFDKGLVFHEQVIEYEDQRRMRFTIKANPHEIPSTAMDEHVVIGGNYFDVLDGTYVLQKLNSSTYRLHLYSHFKLTTTFNFYASWWAGWIMQDIQNNILQVIKHRVEK